MVMTSPVLVAPRRARRGTRRARRNPRGAQRRIGTRGSTLLTNSSQPNVRAVTSLSIQPGGSSCSAPRDGRAAPRSPSSSSSPRTLDAAERSPPPLPRSSDPDVVNTIDPPVSSPARSAPCAARPRARQERAVEVHSHHPAPLLRVIPTKRAPEPVTPALAKQESTRPSSPRRGEGLLDGVLVADVADQARTRGTVPAELVGGRAFRSALVPQSATSAPSARARGHPEPDPGVAAGDEGDVAGEVERAMPKTGRGMHHDP